MRCEGAPLHSQTDMRALLVEDEPKVAAAIKEGLEAEGFQVEVEDTGEGAYFRLVTEAFDVVLLDLTLPGRDGLDVLAAMRERGSLVPTFVLTARDSAEDRAAALGAGAYEYLVKPFAFGDLLERLRRLSPARVNMRSRITVGSLSVDLPTRTVLSQGEPVVLTKMEFNVLACLMRREGDVVTRETLAREVWTETASTALINNVIDVQIARLRRKVDTDGAARLIHTIRGVGFVIRWG